MKNLTLKDLAVKHDYYCSDSNYYSNDASLIYDSFQLFYNEFKDADIDMNLIFRWDLQKKGDSDYYLEVFMIQQRKGIFTPIHIANFNEGNIPVFVELLKPHIEKLKSIWKPFEF